MLSEADFDDLISLDRKDMRRHMLLAAATALLGLVVMAVGIFGAAEKEAAEAAETAEAAGGVAQTLLQMVLSGSVLGKLAGGAITCLSAPPMTKYLKVRRNIDRLDTLRRRWRRLKEVEGSEAGIKEIQSLVLEAMK